MSKVTIRHRGGKHFLMLGDAANPTAGYTSLRNLQASMLWRWRKTKPHRPAWMTTPSRAYKVDGGAAVYKWSIDRNDWLLEEIGRAHV